MRGAVVLVAGCAIACSSEAQNPPPPPPATAPTVTLDPEDAPRAVPAESPAISFGRGGGNNYLDFSSTRIWANGTVRFAARDCERTGTMPAERISQILDELEAKGWLVAPTPSGLGEGKMGRRDNAAPGCATWGVTARRGDKTLERERSECSQTRDRVLDEAVRLISAATGPSPCRR